MGKKKDVNSGFIGCYKYSAFGNMIIDLLQLSLGSQMEVENKDFIKFK